jgi:micrococcal nuclease
VVGISDGDTISVMHGTRAEKIRLNGIDCPEKRQAFGQRAKQFTSKLAFGKDVTVKTFGHDKYGRTLGDVILPDGRTLNHELVRAGLAWWYEKYSKDLALRDLQEGARVAKRGLWVYPDPVPPWEWRHRMSPVGQGQMRPD